MEDDESQSNDNPQGDQQIQKEPLEWDLRYVLPSDIPFIYDSWLKCMHKESRLGKSCTSDVFFRGQTATIDRLLSRCHVHVACSKEDSQIIFGYLVRERKYEYAEKVLHFLLVKKDFRGKNIAESLMSTFQDQERQKDTTYYTHRTENTKSFFKKKYPKFVYNPFILYKGV